MIITSWLQENKRQHYFHLICLSCIAVDSHPLFSFPHHESRVGERYNAIVPEFDESVARDVRNGSEESIASGFYSGTI